MAVARDRRPPFLRRKSLREGLVDVDGPRVSEAMEQLRHLLFKDVPTVRINQEFSEPAMATDMFEYNLDKLNLLLQRGTRSYADNEGKLKEFLL